jgi:hypothetical protein
MLRWRTKLGFHLDLYSRAELQADQADGFFIPVFVTATLTVHAQLRNSW